MSETDPRLGLTVTHRRYVPYAHAHYGGSLVDGAYSLGLFGDVATEVAIVMDGDEGLLAGYSEVRFLGPVRAGDVLEATAEVASVNTNEPNRDGHLRTGDFFEAEKYPEIHFVSTAVRPNGDDFLVDGFGNLSLLARLDVSAQECLY